MNIIDKNGSWLVHDGAFAIVDTTAPTQTRFEPGEPVKATVTDWVKAQPTIRLCADPSTDPDEKALAKIEAGNKAADEARAATQLKAEQAQAAARGEDVEVAAK